MKRGVCRRRVCGCKEEMQRVSRGSVTGECKRRCAGRGVQGDTCVQRLYVQRGLRGTCRKVHAGKCGKVRVHSVCVECLYKCRGSINLRVRWECMRRMRSPQSGLHAGWCATTQKCAGGRWGCCGLQDGLKEGCVCFVRVQGSVCACQHRGTRVPPYAGWAQGARCRWCVCPGACVCERECVCEPAGPALPAHGGTAGRAGGSRPAAARPTPGECRRAAPWDRGRTGRGEPGESRGSGISSCSGPVARGMQLCREDGGVRVWLGLLPGGCCALRPRPVPLRPSTEPVPAEMCCTARAAR